MDILGTIDEYCQMGLNSSEPKHWEAALQDILDLIRDLGENNMKLTFSLGEIKSMHDAICTFEEMAGDDPTDVPELEGQEHYKQLRMKLKRAIVTIENIQVVEADVTL